MSRRSHGATNIPGSAKVWSMSIYNRSRAIRPFWRPKIWPFRLLLAIGITALWLQVLGRVLQPQADESAQ